MSAYSCARTGSGVPGSIDVRRGSAVPATGRVLCGSELKLRRVALGLTQAALADLLGVTANTVARWERGEQGIARPLRVIRMLVRQEERTARTRSPRSPGPHVRTRPRLDGPGSADVALGGPSGRLDNLPAEVSRFIGREKERAELMRLLATARMLTLTGPGGVGKTRLAFQVACDVLQGYRDGVWVVELGALTDSQLVPHTVAAALGVIEQSATALSATLADALRRRRLLLILDNCEHLVGACAELAGMLLRACPDMRVLATSRQPLGVAGEVVWRVPSLSLPVFDRAPPCELGDAEAVQFLVDRISTGLPQFALDETTSPQVAAICRQLDGIPLALELAAARVPSLGLVALVERLCGRLRLFIGAERSVPMRHQTLYATLEWSYGLLNRSEQQVLNRLAVFAAGWTLEAAEVVCATGDVGIDMVPELLGRLVDKSLVQVDDQVDGSRRFRLLEMVRQYAHEQLEQVGEYERAGLRHASFFQALADQVCVETVKASMARWLDRAEQEHDNFRRALEWLIQHRETERAQKLAADLRRFWYMRGYLSEGRSWYGRVLALPGSATTERCLALIAAALLCREAGDYVAMRSLNEQAFEIARSLDDPGLQGLALNGLGQLAQLEGRFAEARITTDEARRLHQLAGDSVWVGLATHHLAQVARDVGDYVSARALAEEALAGFIEVGYTLGTAFARNVLGWICYLEGHLARGAALLEQALNTCRDVGERRGIGENLYHLAHVALEQKDMVLARARLAECLDTQEALGHRRGLALGLEGCARFASQSQRTALALRLAGAAAALRTAVGAPISHSDSALLERWLALARTTLSAECQAVAWASGYALQSKEVLREARTLLTSARRSPSGFAAGLTAREVEVLALLARGRSNKEIGEHLVLSSRTVERHVANVYAKIGAQGRADATAFALRSEVLPLEPT